MGASDKATQKAERKAAKKAKKSVKPETPRGGDSAPLTEDGFLFVKSLHDGAEAARFEWRLCDFLGLDVDVATAPTDGALSSNSESLTELIDDMMDAPWVTMTNFSAESMVNFQIRYNNVTGFNYSTGAADESTDDYDDATKVDADGVNSTELEATPQEVSHKAAEQEASDETNKEPQSQEKVSSA